MQPKKKNVLSIYNLPSEVKFCKICTMSNQRPRITFDENGICSACNFAIFKRNKIDWELREKELITLCDKYRKKNGDYDVIVPCSGGKDGQLGFPYWWIESWDRSLVSYFGGFEIQKIWSGV